MVKYLNNLSKGELYTENFIILVTYTTIYYTVFYHTLQGQWPLFTPKVLHYLTDHPMNTRYYNLMVATFHETTSPQFLLTCSASSGWSSEKYATFYFQVHRSNLLSATIPYNPSACKKLNSKPVKHSIRRCPISNQKQGYANTRGIVS